MACPRFAAAGRTLIKSTLRRRARTGFSPVSSSDKYIVLFHVTNVNLSIKKYPLPKKRVFKKQLFIS